MIQISLNTVKNTKESIVYALYQSLGNRTMGQTMACWYNMKN